MVRVHGAQADVRKGTVESGAKDAREAIRAASAHLATIQAHQCQLEAARGASDSSAAAPAPSAHGFDAAINRPLLGSAPMRKVHFDPFPQARAESQCLCRLVTCDSSQAGVHKTERVAEDSRRHLRDAAIAHSRRFAGRPQNSFRRVSERDRSLAHGGESRLTHRLRQNLPLMRVASR